MYAVALAVRADADWFVEDGGTAPSVAVTVSVCMTNSAPSVGDLRLLYVICSPVVALSSIHGSNAAAALTAFVVTSLLVLTLHAYLTPPAAVKIWDSPFLRVTV